MRLFCSLLSLLSGVVFATSVERPSLIAIWPGSSSYWDKSGQLGIQVHNQIVFMDLRAMSYPYLKTYLDQNIGVQLVVEAWDSYPNLWSLSNGSRDRELIEFFTALKNDGRHVTVRILHEFNAVWYPWGAFYGGSNSIDAYLAAFRHMVGVIRGTGANVSIQQAYNSNTVGGGDSYEAMYVGDAYCDEVTVSAYQFCGSHTDNIMYITEILSPWYNAMRVSGKRLGISEISTTSHCGVDKPGWIKDAFYQMAIRFPRIQTICWFMENKSHNEDLDLNTQAERDAFRDAVYMWKDLTKAGEGDIAPPPPIPDQNKLAQAKRDYEESLKQKGITRHDVVKSPEAHKKLTQQPQQSQQSQPQIHSHITMQPQHEIHIDMNP